MQLPEAGGSGAVGCVIGQALLGTAYEHVLLATLEGLRSFRAFGGGATVPCSLSSSMHRLYKQWGTGSPQGHG